MVYQATGIVARFRLEEVPFNEEEYLDCGGVSADSLLVHVSGDGQETLVKLPCTRMSLDLPATLRPHTILVV
jgi:hypothetical protein